ncbi:MAG: ATPase domain-containing protein [Balneolaceae bacterium]|nr:ATPase domain-containing protein [Balneolaceae bacterium]
MKQKISTGVSGLDDILNGGLIPGRSYLVNGGPGTGKSTLGYHFLSRGLHSGEKVLYISLGESKQSIVENAGRIGIDLSKAAILDLTPAGDLGETGSYSVFSSSEVEQQPIVQSISEAVEEQNPSRVVLDSITMLEFLNSDPYQLRNFGLTFTNYICSSGATLIMITESFNRHQPRDAAFWADGVINLAYDADWRRISVTKYRGSEFRHGNHAFRLSDRGAAVYPRLQPDIYDRSFQEQILSSGIPEIDKMLNGGIEKGTTTLITGASGVGKTNLGLQFFKEAASRNERSVVYTFEESHELIRRRSEQINIPVNTMIEAGNLEIIPVEPLSYSPDEFSEMVRRDVEHNDTQLVMIDTMGGYGIAVRDQNKLERLHALTVYLQNMGVTCFLINETPNVTGQLVTTDMHASYLTDNIIFLRYLEIGGELRKAIGVLKKRLSDFEKTIREFQITSGGIQVGAPLDKIKGILSGNPDIIE